MFAAVGVAVPRAFGKRYDRLTCTIFRGIAALADAATGQRLLYGCRSGCYVAQVTLTRYTSGLFRLDNF